MPNRLRNHAGEFKLAGSEHGDMVVQAGCEGTCEVRLICAAAGVGQPKVLKSLFGARSINGLSYVGGGKYIAMGEAQPAEAGPKGHADRYWRAVVDEMTCSFAPETIELPAGSWFIDAAPLGADSAILLVGRAEQGVPSDARSSEYETPWIVGLGSKAGKELRVAPKQGSNDRLYYMRSIRVFVKDDRAAVVGKIEWIADSIRDNKEKHEIWASIIDSSLNPIWAGPLPGTQAANEVDGAALSSDGTLLVSWMPRDENVFPSVHLEGASGARYLSKFSAKGTLEWQIPHMEHGIITWQPVVIGHDGSAAVVVKHTSNGASMRVWRRLTTQGTLVGEGPNLPNLVFASGASLGGTVGLAWLDKGALHVQHHQWPPAW